MEEYMDQLFSSSSSSSWVCNESPIYGDQSIQILESTFPPPPPPQPPPPDASSIVISSSDSDSSVDPTLLSDQPLIYQPSHFNIPLSSQPSHNLTETNTNTIQPHSQFHNASFHTFRPRVPAFGAFPSQPQYPPYNDVIGDAYDDLHVHNFTPSLPFMDKHLSSDASTPNIASTAPPGLPSFPLIPTSAGNATAKPRTRARRGQATDPHSIAERLRREKIADRMKNLQELVPNSNKADKASMLDEIIEYVKFLQLQVKVLSMSRLGATGAVAPLITDAHTEMGFNGLDQSSSAGEGVDHITEAVDQIAFEQEVVKLMESSVTVAMQYLQSKGLCLMPIALASAISSTKASLQSHVFQQMNTFGSTHRGFYQGCSDGETALKQEEGTNTSRAGTELRPKT